MVKTTKNSSRREKCGVCTELFSKTSSQTAVCCDGCNTWIHSLCTGLNNKEFDAMLADSDSKFYCFNCKKDAPSTNLGSIGNDITDIKRTLDQLLTQQVDVLGKLGAMDEVVNHLKNENNDLRKMVTQQNVRIKALENAKLKSQCFFKHKSDKIDRQNPKKYLLEVAAGIGVNLNVSDVKSIVLQPKLSGNGMSVMKIEFSDSERKFDVMRNKSKCRSSQVLMDVSFFDVLSHDAADLYKAAKGVKTKGYKFVYHRNGKIFVKANEESQPILITSKKTILNLPFLNGSDNFGTSNAITVRIVRRPTLEFHNNVEDKEEEEH